MTSLLVTAIRYFCNFLYLLILFRVILSWVPVSRDNRLIRLLLALTEPILSPIRSVIQRSPLGGPGMVLDFSPLVAYALIMLAQNLLIDLIQMLLG